MERTKPMRRHNRDLAADSIDPLADGTDRIIAAIAAEVAYLEEHGLPIYVDRGDGVEDVQKARART